MGRECRRVPANWQHPKDSRGHHIPLLDGDYETRAAEYASIEDYPLGYSYVEWNGDRPEPQDYMPKFTEPATHYQMYENTSEGTPISPVFKSKKKLAEWLYVTGASWFADMTATNEQWLGMIDGTVCDLPVFTSTRR